MEFKNEIKKEYVENRESLRDTFVEAAEFLDYLESMENQGFHVGTDKNLHFYYKDQFLFYFSIINGTTIEISKKYNRRIKRGTKSNADTFIALLIEVLKQSNLFKRPLEILQKNKTKITLSKTEHSEEFFSLVKKTIKLQAHQVK